MRRSLSSVVTLVLPLTLVALFRGCSDNKHAVTAADFAGLGPDLVSAYCDWQARCCTASEIAAASRGRYATADECRAAGLELSVRDQLSLPAASIDEGRIEARGDVLSICITAYRDRPCTDTTFSVTAPDVNVLLSCPGAITGKVPLGRRCDVVVDCVPGAHCHFDGTTGDGICVPDRQAGDPCDTAADCAPGLSCPTTDFTCTSAQSDAGAPNAAACSSGGSAGSGGAAGDDGGGGGTAGGGTAGGAGGTAGGGTAGGAGGTAGGAPSDAATD
jgi:hypothetical protein